MAGFRTHITTSTVLGLGYGAAAWGLFDVPPETCALAAGLCGVSGMLPDLDSGPGIPLRESLAFAAAVVPMMMLDRFRHMGMPPETMVLAGTGIYLLIRFGLGYFLRHYTVHRGMFHSLPAALISGEIAFLLCTSGELPLRYYKAGAVILGFLSHLILDEIYSIRMTLTGPRLKSSFGTAVKLWGPGLWSNLSTYAKLVVFTLLVLRDPVWVDVSSETKELHEVAERVIDMVRKETGLKDIERK